MREASKRATAAWRERHNLKRAELLVPENTLVSIDTRRVEFDKRDKYRRIVGKVIVDGRDRNGPIGPRLVVPKVCR